MWAKSGHAHLVTHPFRRGITRISTTCLTCLAPLAFSCLLLHTLSMSTVRKAHGPAIRAIRKALGVTQDDLAVSCDVSPGYMSNIESGKKQPSEALVSAICLRLGINKDDVMYVISTGQQVAA